MRGDFSEGSFVWREKVWENYMEVGVHIDRYIFSLSQGVEGCSIGGSKGGKGDVVTREVRRRAPRRLGMDQTLLANSLGFEAGRET